MIFGVLNPEKIGINSLYICPPYLYTVATLPWEIKKSFSTAGYGSAKKEKGGRFLAVVRCTAQTRACAER